MKLPREFTWIAAAQLCLQWCLECFRCHHVSLSLEYRDCSWFQRCRNTTNEVEGFRSLLRVRGSANA